MGFIIRGTEENFRAAKNIKQAGVEIPVYRPAATFNIDKIKQTAMTQKTAYLDSQRSAPLFNDPRYTSSTLAIPTDERSLNGLYRFFSETDPIVGSALKILSELPLASLRLGTCEDTGIQQHYEDQWERINGHKLLGEMVSEYYEIGGATAFGAFNETDYMWTQFAILNPDYVKVEGTWVNSLPLIKLIPDEVLKKIVQTQTPRFLYDQVPEEIKRYVLMNREIPLDPNNTFMISHAKRPYETKGRSVIKRILKTLMLEDRYNQANFALATRHAVPLTVVKVGDPNMNWLPDQADLEAMREWIASWELDPNSSLVYHPGISIEYFGANGRTLPVGPELDRLYRLKFIGLGIHEQLLSGQGGSYSQAYISLEVQRQRYLNLQLKLEQFVHSGLFKVVADLCGFYRVKQAVAGFSGVRKVKYANQDPTLTEVRHAMKFADYDNKDFTEFMQRKYAEIAQKQQKMSKEYVYPKLDFGALSAAYDENNKNFVKWLVDKKPELIDDGTLLRLAKLDRDDQLKAKISDLERYKDFYTELQQKGLLDLFQASLKKPGAGGGGDFSGGMDLGGFGGGMGDVGTPALPTGVGGDPATAQGQEAPAMPTEGGVAAANEDAIKKLVFQDDALIIQENQMLLKDRPNWHRHISN